MIRSTRLTSVAVSTALCSAATLAVLNPMVISVFVTLAREQIIYLTIVDVIIAGLCVLLVRHVTTGRRAYFVLATIGLLSLPFFLAAFEMADSYFRFVATEARFQQSDKTTSSIFEPDPLLGWVHPADATIRDPDFNVVYYTDQRGGKLIRQTTEELRTLHFFGDSFTFGYGVSNDDTALNRLADKLKDRFNVRNYAVVGSGLEQMFVRFRSSLKQVKPRDVVVFSPLAEDLKRNLTFGKPYVCNHVMTFGIGVERFPVFRQNTWDFPRIWDECRFMQTLLFNSRYPVGKLYKKAYEQLVVTFRQEAVIRNADGIFKQAKALAEQNGASFVLLLLVRTEECDERHFAIDLSRLKTDLVSLMPYCPSSPAQLQGLRYDDGHWNAEGNRWAAESMEHLLRVRLANNLKSGLRRAGP